MSCRLTVHKVLRLIPERAQILDKGVEWTWYGLGVGGSWCLRRCRRTAVLPGDPDTPRSGGTGVRWSPPPCYCALVHIWILYSPNSRIVCCTQTHCRRLAQFCWCLCMTLQCLRHVSRSKLPPSSIGLSALSCSVLGPTTQICPDVQGMTGAQCCNPQPGSALLTGGSYGLCLGPDSRRPELIREERQGEKAKPK